MTHTKIALGPNEQQALISALERYIEGDGMPEGDEDEPVLAGIVARVGIEVAGSCEGFRPPT